MVKGTKFDIFRPTCNWVLDIHKYVIFDQMLYYKERAYMKYM